MSRHEPYPAGYRSTHGAWTGFVLRFRVARPRLLGARRAVRASSRTSTWRRSSRTSSRCPAPTRSAPARCCSSTSATARTARSSSSSRCATRTGPGAAPAARRRRRPRRARACGRPEPRPAIRRVPPRRLRRTSSPRSTSPTRSATRRDCSRAVGTPAGRRARVRHRRRRRSSTTSTRSSSTTCCKGEAIALPIALLVLLAVFGLSWAVDDPVRRSPLATIIGHARDRLRRRAARDDADVRDEPRAADRARDRDRLLAARRLPLPRGARTRPDDVDDAVVRTMETAGRAVVFSGATVAIGLALLLAHAAAVHAARWASRGFLIPLVSVARGGHAAAGAALASTAAAASRAARRLLPGRADRPRARLLGAARALDHAAAAASTSRPARRCSSPRRSRRSGSQLTPGSTLRDPALAAVGARVRRPARGGRPGRRRRRRRCVVDTGRGRRRRARGGRSAASGGCVAALRARPRGGASFCSRAARFVDPSGRYAQVIVAGRHDYGEPAAQRFVAAAALDAHPGRAFPAGVARARRRRPAAGRRLPRPGVRATSRGSSLAVLVLTYLLLLRAFRSLLLPLKAVLLNLLSVGASYGMLVVVFRWGVGARPRSGSTRRAGRGLDPDLPVRDALRPVDGLRGVPRHADARDVGRGRRQRDRGRARARAHRADRHRGRDHHGAPRSRASSPGGSSACRSSGSGSRSRSSSTRRSSARCSCPSLMAVFGRWNWWLPEWLARLVRA